MWLAIEASGRPMVLTVEGNPTDSLITLGGYGNAKRVGHDISPHWTSMTSLVDTGAGLWMWAHNSTNATYGGWWNDLDMIEVGNSPDFNCSQDAAALARCQAHFTQWTIMKAPLILGNNIPKMDNATFAVLANTDAISINQDALGIQAQRVYSAPPPNAHALTRGHTAALLAPCDARSPTQTWRLRADGALATRDASGAEWCLRDTLGVGGTPGSWAVEPCGADAPADVFTPSRVALSASGSGALELSADGLRLGWLDSFGGSGPLPHTRYVTASETAAWLGDARALRSTTGGTLRAAAHELTDDDAVGGTFRSTAPFCLDARADGNLEVWAGPLTGGRYAVSLFNRAAVTATITADFASFNASTTSAFAVHDIWANADRGSFTASFSASVPSDAVVYVILSPA